MQHEDETREQLIADRDNLRQQLAALQAKETHYQKLEATLREREREIQALLGVTPHPVLARFDRNLRHLHVNAGVQLATKIPPEAYVGKTSSEMGLPDSLTEIWEGTLKSVFDEGVEKTLEYDFMMANRRWVYHSRVVPEFDANGKVETVIAITRDISQQKDDEETLIENAEVLETVHNLGQVLSGELELEKLVQLVTDAATDLSGAEFGAFFYNLIDERGETYTLYSLAGVPRENFSKFPMPRNTHLFGPTFRGEGTVRIDDVHQDERYGKNPPYHGMPSGHLPVRSYLAVPVISRSREVLGGLFFGHSKIGVFTQKDERIIEGIAAQTAIAIDNARLYQEARNQQERLHTTLASIGDAVIATDAAGHINFMNIIAQSLTGWTLADAAGKPLEAVFRIVNEHTRETAENPVVKVIREGGVVGLANHTVLLTKTGREIPIDDSGAPIRDSDGKMIGVVLVFRDITERKENEQRINLLLTLASAFSQSITSNEVAEVIVDQGLKALGAVVGTVALLVENGDMLEILNLRGLPPAVVEQYRRTKLDFPGPLNDAVRTNSIVWIESFDDYVKRYPHFENGIRANKSRSTVCIPLQVNEKVIGGFTLSFPVPKPRTSDEEEFFIALAHLCALTLERARLYEAEQQARTLAEAIRDSVVALSSTLELSEIFDEILRNVDRVMEHDMADIMLIENGVAGIVRSQGYAENGLVEAEQDMLNFSLRINDTYHMKWVAENKRPSIIYDTQTDQTWIKIDKQDLIRSTLIVPILIDGKITGFLNVNSLKPNFYTPKDGERLQTFADQAAVAIRNAQLHRRALESAALEERHRIARDLHDAVSQTLFSASLIAEGLPKLWDRQPSKVLERIHLLHRLTRGAAAEMRVLLVELRPESLVNANLSDLLSQLGYAMPGREDLDSSIVIQGTNEQPIPPEVQIGFYRIAQESLNNVIKHGQAKRVRIRLVRTDEQVKLVITDNGQGFDIQQNSAGIGLKSMQERANKIGADLKIRSRVGRGTQVSLIWKSAKKN